VPISKQNKGLYPAGKEWKAIREEVLARAFNSCEWPGCGVPNRTRVFRDEDGHFQILEGALVGGRIEIVLTIAHKDHDPRNNGEPGNRLNLAAWCQYHHLKYDAHHHAKNARKTREAKKRQETLL